MKILFRIECPLCKWGHEWRDDYVNMGWLKLRCAHCGEEFYVKVTIPSVDISISKKLPKDVPCFTMPEAK